ncbi:MAG TPA: hypothetical protein VFO16_09840 [Pseudonocardiaceae bacterium]|nr:hypothetical protein [Pseudonocardiaceae bacterium]
MTNAASTAGHMLNDYAEDLDVGHLPAPAALPIIFDCLSDLPEDERCRWLRGRRVILQIAAHGGTVARSTAYYLSRLRTVQATLTAAGFVTTTDPVHS